MDAAGKSVDLARELLGPVGGTLADVWGRLVGDRMAYWRARNALQYQPLLNEEAARLGLKLKPEKIPDRYAFAWFEEATKQDEPELQVLFARLLARAADENAEAGPDRRLIDVLGRLTPADAALFQRLYSDVPFPGMGTYEEAPGLGRPINRGYAVDWLTSLLTNVHPDYSPVTLDNLVVQGCVTRQWRLQFDRHNGRAAAISYSDPERKLREELNDSIPRMVRQREYIDATELGLALYAAVKP